MGWAIRRKDGSYRAWQAASSKPDWALDDNEEWEERETAPTVGPPLNKQYIEKRRAAYPPIGDQLDAIYWAAKGDPKPQLAIFELITAVKALYPKPI